MKQSRSMPHRIEVLASQLERLNELVELGLKCCTHKSYNSGVHRDFRVAVYSAGPHWKSLTVASILLIAMIAYALGPGELT